MGDPVEVDDGGSWQDQRTTYDALRSRCPVAHDDGRWIALRHAEVVAAATDPDTFSSQVGTRRAVPNSLDGAEHQTYRAVIDRYFTDDRVAAEEAQCRAHAVAIVESLPRGATVKTVGGIGVPYAVRSQSTWLGWPHSLEDDLVTWMADNHAATRSGDRNRTREVALRFDAMIQSLLDARRGIASGSPGQFSGDHSSGDDVTSQLMREEIDGRVLSDEEVVSILRNWTAGDLGSLATSVGVIVHHLAAHPEIQDQVRSLVANGNAAGVEAAVEEILRIDDPFVANRRVATRTTTLGGETIREGDQVLLNWTAANRDPLVFGDPDAYDPVGHAEANLVFGIGPHVCPGRTLTLMELRVVVEELLRRTTSITPATDRPAVRETPPMGGWSRVPVVLR